MPLADKKALADAVIDNNGDINETKRQVKAILSEWYVI
jgi:dephospho-CoA kinase